MSDRRQLLQESLAAIERLEARLRDAEQALHQPIAIVGAGCRYPGGIETPEALWNVVRDGVDAVSEVPPERWDANAYFDPDPKALGKMVTKRGGFLSQISGFDPQLFGISPREAATMDPQQRLLLETAWEALESAGQPTDKLSGSATGVFVGITTSDYGQLLRLGGPANSDVYSATGAALNAAAGRVSFTFGFQGPCVALDTACSSSLVAVHLACQSLRTGESDLALAGGVNVILSPDAMILFSKWGMMAPDGACKTFDASADGFVRAEGCAMIALKRLADARAAGDPILAVIRGSAVNSDGRSSGLTVPNGPAQQAVLRKALASAQLNPADIDYVEAHGTGTSLGDPIEVEALGSVMRKGRQPDRPLLIGSIKTNLGHTEAASGLAGLLKVVMSLRHQALPPHLHFSQPNPGIPWAELPISVPTTLTPWRRGARIRRAGVSSFGFSGTNAHVILEEAPLLAETPVVAPETPFLVPLSARNEAAVRQLAGRYAEAIAGDTAATLAEIAVTAATGRAPSLHRLTILTSSLPALAKDLADFSTGQMPATATVGAVRRGETPKIGFLFTGQGAQYAGMGRRLYERQPVFRDVLDKAAAILAPLLPRPLLEVMFGDRDTPTLLGETAYTQPALFALEYALAELWRSWGITPAIVAGHSVGEYVAACVAGAISLEDGLALIAERGRLMQALPAGGAMAAVFASEARVAAVIAPAAARLALAGVNGPEEIVISGAAQAVDEALAMFTAQGIKSRRLEVSHAFHSPLLDPMLDAFEQRARGINAVAPRIPLVSNLTGRLFAPDARPDAAYWRQHARQPVRFAACVQSLREAGVTTLVELGPHATLLALARSAAPDATWTTVSSLRRNRDDEREILAALGALYVRGAGIKWDAVYAGKTARRVPLPTYPFQRERHWISTPANAAGPTRAGHPLLGPRQDSPLPGAQFMSELGAAHPAFLAEHVVYGAVVFPGTAYVEMALAAARALGGAGTLAVRDFSIEAPLGFEGSENQLVHLMVEQSGEGRRGADVPPAGLPFVVRSVKAGAGPDAPWRVNAKGRLAWGGAHASPATGAVSGIGPIANLRDHCPTALDVDRYYGKLRETGLDYGPTFRALSTLQVGASDAVGLIAVPGEEDGSQPTYTLHPALLDAAFHLLGASLLSRQTGDDEDRIYLPIGVDDITVVKAASSRVWAAARIRATEPATGDPPGLLVADLRLEDETGGLIATVTGLRLRAITAATLERALSPSAIAQRNYEVVWRQLDAAAAPANVRPLEGPVVVLADKAGFATALVEALERAGARCVTVPHEDVATLDASTLAPRLRDANGGAPAWIVDCGELGAARPDVSPPASARAAYLRLLRIVQASALSAPNAGLCVVTRGAQTIAEGDDAEVSLSVVVGLVRTVRAERAPAAAVHVDLDPAGPPDVRPLLASLFGLGAVEPELGVRNGNLFAPRLEERGPRARATIEHGQREVLRIGTRGALDGLALVTEARRPPAPHEVEIDIRAAGVNFRDVLNTLGMVPGEPGPLGSECSGIVRSVGSAVTHVRPGDEVVAFAIDSMATSVTAPAALVLRKPANLTFADAVTLPNTYLTAHQALAVVPGLGPGHRVLVHAAAGGVGLAALRLALRAGAEVIATAGTPDKRAFVRAAGAAYVFDSRTPSFADDVLRVTGGAGVDLVINSLADELVAAGLRTVSAGGHFVEIGKKDILTPAEAARRAPHVRYHVVDLGRAMIVDLASVRTQFETLLDDVGAGRLAPLPLRTFPLRASLAAFRYMATARHVGKIVLIPELGDSSHGLPIHTDATYLITGGLGGLGFACAEWLVARGARTLLLVGRRPATPADEGRMAALRDLGANVAAVGCDLADPQAVQALWRDQLMGRPPLRGIIHAAGVLADAPLAQQDAAKLEVVAPGKIDAAWSLHQQTLHLPLDFFAMFSSSSALFGSPGQANYAAANAFLDGLAHHRRGRGLPTTSIAWGAWATVGMAARLSDIHRERWAKLGVGLLQPAAAFQGLEAALAASPPHTAIIAIDPKRVVAQGNAGVRALFGQQARALSENSAATTKGPDALAALRAATGLDPAAKLALLGVYVHQEAASVLGFNATALDRDTPLSAMGFDSLMAVQFRNRVQTDLNLELSLASLLAGPTVAQLIEEIAQQLDSGRSAGAVAPADGDSFEEGSL